MVRTGSAPGGRTPYVVAKLNLIKADVPRGGIMKNNEINEAYECERSRENEKAARKIRS